MTLAIVTSGTTTPTVGTASTLVTQTPGQPTTYVMRVDTSAMVSGDLTHLLIYSKCLSGGAYQIEHDVWVDGDANDDPMLITPPTPTDIAMQITLTQVTGTARAFPWKLFSL